MAIKNILNMNNQDFAYSQYSSKNNTIYANETLCIANNVTTNFRDTAKILGVRENLLVNWLLLNNYCYRDRKRNNQALCKIYGVFPNEGFYNRVRS